MMNTTNDSKGSAPSHILYDVKETGSEQAIWNRIGAAWPNKDGSLTLKLEYLPMNSDGRLQLRLNEPKEKQQAG